MTNTTPSPKGVGVPPGHPLLPGLFTPSMFSGHKDLLLHPQLAAAAAAAAAYSPYLWPGSLPAASSALKDVNFNHLQSSPQLNKGRSLPIERFPWRFHFIHDSVDLYPCRKLLSMKLHISELKLNTLYELAFVQLNISNSDPPFEFTQIYPSFTWSVQ